MKLMLTSFGIEQTLSSRKALFDRVSDVMQAVAPVRIGPTSLNWSLFDRMPPVSFHSVNEAFMPDYEHLILCDQVVMDATSFQQLISSPSRAYSAVADTFRALKTEGRVELIDYSSILRSNADLLDKMLDRDMRTLDQWVVPLRESLTMWGHFAQISSQIQHDENEEFRTLGTRTPDTKLDAMQRALRYFEI